MINKIDFFYKVSREAGFAEDDDGNPSECYLKLSFNLKNPISEEQAEHERERSKDDAMQAAADFLKVDMSLLEMVTEEEYLSETEED